MATILALSEQDFSILKKANLPVELPKGITNQQMMDYMAGDKKVLDGHLHLVLFKQQATSFISANYDKKKLQQTIDSFIK